MVNFDGVQGSGGFVIREGMTNKEVLQAAKSAGIEGSIFNRLEKAIGSDSDGIVSNRVEANMLRSIVDPAFEMPTAPADIMDESDDGVYTEKMTLKDNTGVNTSYAVDTGKMLASEMNYTDKNGKTYSLYDSDGDGKPNGYMEFNDFEGFDKTRQICFDKLN